jgi:hypothetical protein
MSAIAGFCGWRAIMIDGMNMAEGTELEDAVRSGLVGKTDLRGDKQRDDRLDRERDEAEPSGDPLQPPPAHGEAPPSWNRPFTQE